MYCFIVIYLINRWLNLIGFLVVTIAVEAIGVIYYIHIKNRNRFDYVNSYFDEVEIISIVEVSHNSSSQQT